MARLEEHSVAVGFRNLAFLQCSRLPDQIQTPIALCAHAASVSQRQQPKPTSVILGELSQEIYVYIEADAIRIIGAHPADLLAFIGREVDLPKICRQFATYGRNVTNCAIELLACAQQRGTLGRANSNHTHTLNGATAMGRHGIHGMEVVSKNRYMYFDEQ